MKQLYVDADLLAPTIAVDAETVHRLRRVLRVRAGDQLVAADGRGRTRLCTWNGRELVAAEPVVVRATQKPHLIVAAGLLKGPRWDWLLEKCTELGADEIAPLTLQHCVAAHQHKQIANKLLRWRSIAREAFEQCGRATLPEVHAPLTLADWLAREQQTTVFWGDERGVISIVQAMNNSDSLASAQRAAVVIGPEGGLSAGEITALRSFGGQPVSLAPAILRAETAAIVACAAVAQWRRSR